VRFEECIIHHNTLNEYPFHKPNFYVLPTLLVKTFSLFQLTFVHKMSHGKVMMVKIWQHPAIGSAAVHCLTVIAASAVSSGPQL
jgi:hypothetical protein